MKVWAIFYLVAFLAVAGNVVARCISFGSDMSIDFIYPVLASLAAGAAAFGMLRGKLWARVPIVIWWGATCAGAILQGDPAKGSRVQVAVVVAIACAVAAWSLRSLFLFDRTPRSFDL